MLVSNLPNFVGTLTLSLGPCMETHIELRFHEGEGGGGGGGGGGNKGEWLHYEAMQYIYSMRSQTLHGWKDNNYWCTGQV